MTVINFHEHPNEYTMENCRSMGCDKAVLLPVGTREIGVALNLAQEYPGQFYPFHWIDLDSPVDQEVKRLRLTVERHGVKGIKFQPMVQHFQADERRLYPVYEAAEELGLVLTFHMGVVKLDFTHQLGKPMLSRYCGPLPLDAVAFDFPSLAICIAHLGGNHLYTALTLAEKHERIYLDTAFLGFFAPRFFPAATPAALIRHAVSIAGDCKVLYGGEGVQPSDVLETGLPEQSLERILWRNAMKLLS